MPVKLRVEDYLLLDDSGAFDGYAKTELIDGKLFFMHAQQRPHSRIKTELGYRMREALAAAESPLAILIEPSVAAPPHDVPEPDIVVTSEPQGEGPVPLASVALIVEVSAASRDFDLGPKARLYARHQVPEYWVVDVTEMKIYPHWSPGADGYGERQATAMGERITSATIAGLTVETRGIG
jgi:Uma2 family endonuclease